MSIIRDFLQDVDRQWSRTGPPKIRLRIIGSAALMLQSSYRRGTKDSDVLETAQLTDAIKRDLLVLAGAGTPLHLRHRLYIDIVASGLPFLPQAPQCHPLNLSLRHFDIEVLDIVDVIVSKLKRFNVNDADDIRAMVDMGLVHHRKLIDRFQNAVDIYTMDARAEDLPTYVRNLHRVERDHFGTTETEIDLPDWI